MKKKIGAGRKAKKPYKDLEATADCSRCSGKYIPDEDRNLCDDCLQDDADFIDSTFETD